ncbi:MAG: hypothetical protein WC955_06990 [Elusimicrobiota bacterium]
MNKNVVIGLLIMFLCIPKVYSGDLLSWLINPLSQYSLAVGTVIDKKNGKIVVNIKKVISGNELSSRIEINSSVSSSVEGVNTGDHIVVSLDKTGADYSIKWGIMKTSTSEYEALQVLEAPLGPAETAAFQRYINSGGKDNDFIFYEDKAYLRKWDGTKVLLYPSGIADVVAALPANSASVVLPGQTPAAIPLPQTGNAGFQNQGTAFENEKSEDIEQQQMQPVPLPPPLPTPVQQTREFAKVSGGKMVISIVLLLLSILFGGLFLYLWMKNARAQWK